VDDPEERLSGTTPRGQAASGLLVSLARAARSFLLYDPSNEAIRHFLEKLRSSADSYFNVYGDLDLEVRPFELATAGEVIYLDRDRERSLAFRLFRDGVRRVLLRPEVNWPELLKFLEIMSIRYTGVRQTEDDLVVLLWRAGFRHIEVEAVEGLEADDGGESDAMIRAQAATFAGVPETFDLPAPTLGPPAPVAYVPLAPELLAPLVEEDGTYAVPGLCERLVEELTNASLRGEIPFAEVLPSLRELRDFLLGEGTIHPLLRTARLLRDLPLEDPADQEGRDQLIMTFADPGSLARLLRSVPRDARGASQEVVELLDLLPGDHLRTLVKVLEIEKGESARRAARTLIENYVATRAEWLQAYLTTADASVAAELLRAISHASLEHGLQAAERLVERHEMEVEFEMLHLLGRAPVTPQIGRLLGRLVASPHDEIRLRAMEAVRNRAVVSAFRPLVEYLKRVAQIRLDEPEAAMAGEAMARADAMAALAQFREWARPPGLFTVVLPGHVRLHFVAVAGLTTMPGEEPERLVTALKTRAEAPLQAFIIQAMIRRRRNMRGGGG